MPALVLSVVDTRTAEAHRVAIETAALHRRSGRYPALCGAEVLGASLTAPPRTDCAECLRRSNPAQDVAPPHRSAARSGRRWLQWGRPSHP